MNTVERIVLWLAIVFLLYQNSSVLTEDQVSDIASDVATDEIKDAGCVTEDIFEAYVTIDAANEVFGKISDRLFDAEYNITNNGKILDYVGDLHERIIDLENRHFTEEEKIERMKKAFRDYNRGLNNKIDPGDMEEYKESKK